MLVNRYLWRIGITDRFGPHLLRHTFATHALRARPNLRAVQEVLGHSSVTTQRYTHMDADDLRQQVSKLAGNRNQQYRPTVSLRVLPHARNVRLSRNTERVPRSSCLSTTSTRSGVDARAVPALSAHGALIREPIPSVLWCVIVLFELSGRLPALAPCDRAVADRC